MLCQARRDGGVLEGGELREDGARECDLLRAFDGADEREVQREVQRDPRELADGADVRGWGVVEVD